MAETCTGPQSGLSPTSEPFMEALLDGYAYAGSFDGVGTLVDVGGSSGACLEMIMRRVGTIREGLNFDMPDVVAAAPPIAIDDKEKPTHLRFLVSNTAAGCIIGKGGSTINEFQSQSGARIQLSRSHEFFPGTNDRIIMVSGLFDEVMKAMELILEKLLAEGEEFNEAEARPKVRLVVPNSSCGGIIGKGGATIKSFIEESHVGIKISPQDNNYVGLHDRLVTVTGTFDNQMNAIDLILKKLSEDVHYPPNLSSPFPYAGLTFPSYPGVPVLYMIPQVPYNNAVNYGPNGYGGRYQNNKPTTPMRSPANNDAQNSLTIGVADEHIGAVVGRAGRNITEIIQASGARIKISDRGDFITGTSDRKVTITGTSEAIRTAESMILQRVSASSER